MLTTNGMSSVQLIKISNYKYFLALAFLFAKNLQILVPFVIAISFCQSDQMELWNSYLYFFFFEKKGLYWRMFRNFLWKDLWFGIRICIQQILIYDQRRARDFAFRTTTQVHFIFKIFIPRLNWIVIWFIYFNRSIQRCSVVWSRLYWHSAKLIVNWLE